MMGGLGRAGLFFFDCDFGSGHGFCLAEKARRLGEHSRFKLPCGRLRHNYRGGAGLKARVIRAVVREAENVHAKVSSWLWSKDICLSLVLSETAGKVEF